MKTIVFLWVVTLAAIWIGAAMMHYFERAWWSFPAYFTGVVLVTAFAGFLLLRERDV